MKEFELWKGEFAPMRHCPDGAAHVWGNVEEEWVSDGNGKHHWTAYKKCLKCNFEVGARTSGCIMAYDKQHNWEEGSYVDENGVLMAYKKCLNCNTSFGAREGKEFW